MKRLVVFFIILFFSSPLFAVDVGDEAPDFTLNKLGGGTFTLNDYRGKVVYIFWFGHGCPFCPANGYDSQKMVADKYSTDVFQAVGVDTWSGSNESNVGSFKEGSGITYPLLIGGRDVQIEYSITYDRSMVIDQNGIIQYYGGSHQPHNWNEINNQIEDLLSATAINNNLTSPVKFELKNNYPNPFNPETRIPFSVDKTQNIKLEIYNISGKLIRTIINAPFAKGNFEASWNGTNDQGIRVGSGVYFSRLQGENLVKMKQLLLIK